MFPGIVLFLFVFVTNTSKKNLKKKFQVVCLQIPFSPSFEKRLFTQVQRAIALSVDRRLTCAKRVTNQQKKIINKYTHVRTYPNVCIVFRR